MGWGFELGRGSYLWAETPKSCCFLQRSGPPGSQSRAPTVIPPPPPRLPGDPHCDPGGGGVQPREEPAAAEPLHGPSSLAGAWGEPTDVDSQAFLWEASSGSPFLPCYLISSPTLLSCPSFWTPILWNHRGGQNGQPQPTSSEMAATSCPALPAHLTFYFLSSDSDPGVHCPYCGSGGPLSSEVCTLLRAQPRMEERRPGKQHGQCISGGHSDPRMEAESQAEQGHGHAARSQEQPQAQKQQQQGLVGAESSWDHRCRR